MTWRMARQLLAAGMTVGGHTVSHPILARLDEDAQRAEVLVCRARLEAELGIPMRWFSYPNGDLSSFDARTRAIVREAGVELAFSFEGGFVRHGARWDPYALPRIAVGPRTAGAAFAATVTLPQVFGGVR
jgi:peptidoglycan/xylan/chitin deacetylase (PgdA/CDA1 family)